MRTLKQVLYQSAIAIVREMSLDASQQKLRLGRKTGKSRGRFATLNKDAMLQL